MDLAMLGINKSTLSKWENNEDPVGAQSDRLIRALTVCLSRDLNDSVEALREVFPRIDNKNSKNVNYQVDAERNKIELTSSVA